MILTMAIAARIIVVGLVSAIVGFIAQAGATEALERFNAIWLLVGGVVPFIYPWFVKANAGEAFKFVLSLVLSVIAAGLVLIPQGGFSELGIEGFILWAFGFIGVVQVVFKVVNIRVKETTGQPLGEQSVYLPERGLG